MLRYQFINANKFTIIQITWKRGKTNPRIKAVPENPKPAVWQKNLFSE